MKEIELGNYQGAMGQMMDVFVGADDDTKHEDEAIDESMLLSRLELRLWKSSMFVENGFESNDESNGELEKSDDEPLSSGVPTDPVCESMIPPVRMAMCASISLRAVSTSS
ncbi:hypothetical protein BLOT_016523 [Blomia tropicalis]|nr:hypothetical protein BLOT_016523 [Blomia tropicalis]